MSKQYIYSASILIMLAALLAVSAQEDTASLSDAAMNNTTLLNNTTLNASLNETVIETPIAPAEIVNEMAPIETVSEANESSPAASEIIPVQNETAAVQNETVPVLAEEIAPQDVIIPLQNDTVSDNVTLVAEPVTIASPMQEASQTGVIPIGSPQRNVFAIGGSQKSPNLFSIDGKALAQGAFEVGLPAKTIMDLSALPFFTNKI